MIHAKSFISNSKLKYPAPDASFVKILFLTFVICFPVRWSLLLMLLWTVACKNTLNSQYFAIIAAALVQLNLRMNEDLLQLMSSECILYFNWNNHQSGLRSHPLVFPSTFLSSCLPDFIWLPRFCFQQK